MATKKQVEGFRTLQTLVAKSREWYKLKRLYEVKSILEARIEALEALQSPSKPNSEQ